jgi:hypothetical protein
MFLVAKVTFLHYYSSDASGEEDGNDNGRERGRMMTTCQST